jgi:hypothetical protein
VKGSCRTGLSNIWPTVVYGVVHPCFDIYKVLLSSFFYCVIHHSNPAKLNARSVLYPCVFCIEELTNELQGNVTYFLAQAVKLDFGFGPQCLTVHM